MRKLTAIINASVMTTALLCSTSASADILADLANCQKMTDPTLRLECFDTVAEYYQSNTDSVVAVTPAPAPKAGSVQPAQQSLEKPAASSDRFGLTARDENEPDQIISYIPGAFRGWDKDTVFYLANGQVWEPVGAGNTLVWKATDPKVTIEKGFFGSFYLGVEGVNKRIKVRRIK